MDSIRHLLQFFIKIALAFFVAAFVFWLISLARPSIHIGKFFSLKTASSTVSEDWLPSPRTYAKLFKVGANTPNEYTNVYTPGPAFNGYGGNNNQYTYSTYNYVTYTSTGTVITKGTTGEQVSQNSSSLQKSVARAQLIRNLSVYEGGHVYTGLAFVGEAKSSMFKNGRFPIIVADQTGRVIGISAAIATTNWTVPGWARFETKIIYPLPVNVPCSMIFEEALTNEERAARAPQRVSIPVRCN
jgi:hypothetical protein